MLVHETRVNRSSKGNRLQATNLLERINMHREPKSCRDCGLKQLRHLRLREPDGFIFQPHLQPRPAILRLVEDNLAAGFGFVGWHGQAL